MNDAAIFAGLGAVIILLLIAAAYFNKLRRRGKDIKIEAKLSAQGSEDGKIQCLDVDQRDSLDEHLDVLTKKLAEKEGRLRLSKSKIRETQNEMDNLHAIDQDVRYKYREVMDSLKIDLISNEKECKKLQEQIEWVSLKRAELKDEMSRGQRMYGVAAAELADNLAELQRGRIDGSVIDKPMQFNSSSTLKHRKDPVRSRLMNASSIKTPSSLGTPPSYRHYFVDN